MPGCADLADAFPVFQSELGAVRDRPAMGRLEAPDCSSADCLQGLS